MTTEAAAKLYEAQHVLAHERLGVAVFNPLGKAIAELPAIYGFNNGGSPGWMRAVLIAEDGTVLGGHVCSSEVYMPADLGILEGARPDRHETFRAHYPDGYRMEFVPYSAVREHPKLSAAFAAFESRRAKPVACAHCKEPLGEDVALNRAGYRVHPACTVEAMGIEDGMVAGQGEAS